MIVIDKFAFCFFANDINKVVEQEKEIIKLTSKYQIERWYRHDRVSGKYTSFSQMVNDAIDDTDSEFMIFCNPKTNFISEDIETILDKLSSGYCLATVVSFGLFGFSKELIRRIGMMDERFINGEWEDNDFAVRLNHFGKAVYWMYDYDKYTTLRTKAPNLTYITRSIFADKYNITDDTIYVDSKLFNHKKISKRHREKKQFIYDSWMSSEHTVTDCYIRDFLFKNVVLENPTYSEKNVNFNLKISRDLENYRLELNSDTNIKVFFSLLKSIEDGGTSMWNNEIFTNQWKTVTVFHKKEMELRLFINDNQFFVTMISPIDELDLNFRVPVLIKW
jgi:hypothetical protein